MTRVELANFDPAAGRITLNVTNEGAVLAERTVTVGPSTERTVLLATRFRAPGTYDLSVNGEPVGSVTVRAPTGTPTAVTATPTQTRTPGRTETTEPTSTPTGTTEPPTTEPPTAVSPETTGDGPGFGPALAVFALLVCGLLLRQE